MGVGAEQCWSLRLVMVYTGGQISESDLDGFMAYSGATLDVIALLYRFTGSRWRCRAFNFVLDRV